jgi:hypothetical protein
MAPNDVSFDRAGLAHAAQQRYEPQMKTFVYVSNRLEGNALETIAAVVAHTIALLNQPVIGNTLL